MMAAYIAIIGSLTVSCLGAIVRDEAFAKQEQLQDRRPLDVKSAKVRAAAEWFLGELKPLSDSGVFETLELGRILEASEQEGVYHFNTFLTVELKSPHLAGGLKNSVHDVIVMEDLKDKVRSFAIDEFPVMDADSVEKFWQDKVDREIVERDQLLDELEAEAERMQQEWIEQELGK